MKIETALIFVPILLFCSSIFAQGDTLEMNEGMNSYKRWYYIPEVGVGAVAGLQYKKLSHEVHYDLETSTTFSFNGGVIIERRLNKSFGIQSGFKWRWVGDNSPILQADSIGYNFFQERQYKMRALTLSIPINFRFYFGERLDVTLSYHNVFSTGFRNSLWYGDNFILNIEGDSKYRPAVAVSFAFAVYDGKFKLSTGPELMSFLSSHGKNEDDKYDFLPARYLNSISWNIKAVF